ncbi:hypothetical protein KUCAC02_010345, partial [Chaenocephalus aceratus]
CAATMAQANKSVPAPVNPFTLAAKGKMTVEKREECHRKDQVEKELQMYKAMPRIVTSDDAAAWWWNMRTTYPYLSDMAFSYLCVQASSTPS